MKFCTNLLAITGVMLMALGSAHAQEGLVSVDSPHSVAMTMDKLQAALESKGMTIFKRVDHAQGAANVDLELRPTQVLIFGNPKVGTPLMQCSQSIAIDLPQKMLAWEDASGGVHLGWNDPAYMKSRHGTTDCDAVFEKISGVLGKFAKAATAQ